MAERIYIDRPLPPGFDELFGPGWVRNREHSNESGNQTRSKRTFQA